jgi:hypothetical protein
MPAGFAEVTRFFNPGFIQKTCAISAAMTTRTFFPQLALVSAAAAAVLVALHFFAPPAQPHWKFAIGTVLIFILVCTALFFAGKNAAQSKNKYLFTNLVSASVFGKMVLALALLFAYQRVALPQNQWFVGIFLWCYTIFTVFEVWFMTKLAKA